MKNYEIANKDEVDSFINAAIIKCQSITAIKGKAPHGAMYSDGDLVIRPVNVGWLNEQTGQSVDIVYKPRQLAKAGEL